MNLRQVLKIYDEEYAGKYDDRFILSEPSKIGFKNEVKIVAEFLRDGGKWLDVACGTGSLLSCFPGVPRAGVDISPAMLERARRANPDALFFKEGNFKNPAPEWQGQWDLVTCMWYAYCLVESMAEVHQLIENLSSWTSAQGTCFMPVWDPHILSKDVSIPYRIPDKQYGGDVLLVGVNWSWIEDSGKRHENMVAPNPDYMKAAFQEYFRDVNLISYPLSRFGRAGRKAIVARAKKTNG